MRKTICDICGKEFDVFDEQERFGFHHTVGYGSEFDGSRIDVDLCCRCFDIMMNEYILPQCKKSPVKDGEF